MTADDAVTRWSQRKLLEALSRNTRQPVLAEMAREMLAGRLTTRQAMASDAYMQALGTAARPGLARLRDMPPEELAASEREARLAAERLMVAEERDAAAARRRGPVEEEPTGSIMVGAPGRPAAAREPEVAADAWLPRSVRDRAGRRRPVQ